MGSLKPSYADWVILLQSDVVMSGGEISRRKMWHALICRCDEKLRCASSMDIRDTSLSRCDFGSHGLVVVIVTLHSSRCDQIDVSHVLLRRGFRQTRVFKKEERFIWSHL
jgi:hypothetical protein